MPGRHREAICILWMDDREARFHCDSTSVIQAVLNLYGVTDWETGAKLPDKHFPISNIRYWDKDGVTQ